MQVSNNIQKLQKYKRILLFYNELQRSQLNNHTIVDFICSFFHIGQTRIYNILKQYDINKLANVDIPDFDLDLIYIDEFIKKTHKKAIKERKEAFMQQAKAIKQPNLFETI